MTNVLKFRPRSFVVRRDPPQRRCPVTHPHTGNQHQRRSRPPLFLWLLLALALTLLAILGKETERHAAHDGFQAAVPTREPRSLRGGSAWNRIGGGFAGSASQSMTGRVTHVRDGDTFVVGDTPIRIANLDCAESGTLRGDLATRRAVQIASGQTVTCRLNTQTSYDRLIGLCALPDGRDFGDIMIDEGSCGRN